MTHLNNFGKLAVCTLAITALSGCPRTSGNSNTKPLGTAEPTITQFSVTPSEVCLNTTTPLVQVSYSFDPDGWQNPRTLCTVVKANDTLVHDTIRHQCLDDGSSGNVTFDLEEIFGSNTPSAVDVKVELKPLVANSTYDSRSATVTARVDCS